ncbi:hypothetical protein HPMBJEAJ_00126 [Aeromonas phage avDM6]|nr:hypothetical protein HPMBJEAJ_00126 [Aeromonas phage avDM6]
MKIEYFNHNTYLGVWQVNIGTDIEQFHSRIKKPVSECWVDYEDGKLYHHTPDYVKTVWEFEPNSEVGDDIYKAFVRVENEKHFTKVWLTSELTISIPTNFLKKTKYPTHEFYVKEYKRWIGSNYPSDMKSVISSTIEMLISRHRRRHMEDIPHNHKTVESLCDAINSINFTMDDIFL